MRRTCLGAALLPVIGVDPVNFGTAKGEPDVATVGDADGLVQLFHSAPSPPISRRCPASCASRS